MELPIARSFYLMTCRFVDAHTPKNFVLTPRRQERKETFLLFRSLIWRALRLLRSLCERSFGHE